MNVGTAVQCGLIAAAFAILPQSVSAPLVGLTTVGVLLYLLNGKLPQE